MSSGCKEVYRFPIHTPLVSALCCSSLLRITPTYNYTPHELIIPYLFSQVKSATTQFTFFTVTVHLVT